MATKMSDDGSGPPPPPSLVELDGANGGGDGEAYDGCGENVGGGGGGDANGGGLTMGRLSTVKVPNWLVKDCDPAGPPCCCWTPPIL